MVQAVLCCSVHHKPKLGETGVEILKVLAPWRAFVEPVWRLWLQNSLYTPICKGRKVSMNNEVRIRVGILHHLSHKFRGCILVAEHTINVILHGGAD